MEFTRTRPAKPFEIDNAYVPARVDGDARLHVTLYRTDRRQTVRLDVPFQAGQILRVEGKAEARADAHAALDVLLDNLF